MFRVHYGSWAALLTVVTLADRAASCASEKSPRVVLNVSGILVNPVGPEHGPTRVQGQEVVSLWVCVEGVQSYLVNTSVDSVTGQNW